MQIRDEITSEVRHIFPTKELKADLKKHDDDFDCEHPDTQVRLRLFRGGVKQIRRQCLRCGSSDGNAIKRDAIKVDPPPFDESLALKFDAAKRADYDAILRKHLALQQRREASHQKEYDAYRYSPKWMEKRRKVFERANGICEGCREQTATEVHHLTYEHIYNEFLFELVALCRSCHNQVHASKGVEAKNLGSDDALIELPCCGCRYQSENGCQPWCGKFDISAGVALAEGGECGPDQRELECLK